jgi:hypothetical protein
MSVLVLFDTRLAFHGNVPYREGVDAAFPKDSGDALILSNGDMPLGYVVNSVASTAKIVLKPPRVLHIYCHAFEAPSGWRSVVGGIRGVPKVGGYGLKLGQANLNQQNANVVQVWAGIFERIVVYACGVAYDESVPSGGRLESTGSALCGALARYSKTPWVAPDAPQPYHVNSDGIATARCRTPSRGLADDFDPMRGQIYTFDPVAGARHLYMGRIDEL